MTTQTIVNRLRHGIRGLFNDLLKRRGYSLVHDSVNWQSTRGLDHRLLSVLARDLPGSGRTVIFDVGANSGTTARRLKTSFPDAQIYCFEPVTETFNQLVGNLKDLRGITPCNLALGADEGTSRIYLRENSEWNSLVPEINDYLRDHQHPFTDVQRTTIDLFSAQHGIERIDLLKIDTEGYEKEVLQGAQQSLGAGLVRAIYLEVGFDRQQLQHSFYLDLLEQMDRLGFRFSGFFEMSIDIENRLDFANALFIRS
jgi:FkbM family methyltransferase